MHSPAFSTLPLALMNQDAYGAKVRAKLAGKDTIPPPSGYQVFAPAIDVFLKQHLFADIFVRDNLEVSHQEAESARQALSKVVSKRARLTAIPIFNEAEE